MLQNPIIQAAEAAAQEMIAAAQPIASPREQRDLARLVDREVVFPLVAPAPTVEHRTLWIPVPGRRDLRIHLFAPADVRPQAALLFFFGGAFRQGAVDFLSVDALLRSRAAKSQTLIVAPDYALAPEEPFPTALEQGMAALQWLHLHADEFGVAHDRISIGGMSAGGDLAASIALANRDGRRFPIRQQILEVPVTDLTGGHLSPELAPHIGFHEDLVLPMMEEMARNYLAGEDPRNPAASPLLAPDLSDLPPAHVLTAEFDVFRGDGEAYVVALQKHGTKATEHRFPGMTHGSLAFTREVLEAQQWERAVVELLLS